MLSFELVNYYEYCMEQLHRLDETLKPLRDFASSYEELLESVGMVIFGSGYHSEAAVASALPASKTFNYVKKFNEVFSRLISSFSLLNFLTIWSEVKNNLANYQEENEIPDTFISEYMDKIESIMQLLQAYYNNNTIPMRNNLSDMIVSFYSLEKYIFSHYEQVLSALASNKQQDDSTAPQENQLITIQLLTAQLNVDEFSGTLAAINNIYECISRYSDTGIHLEIIKIESGSLFAKLFGDENIMSVMGNLLNRFIDWFFRKYTTEGKLARLSDTQNAVKETFAFTQLLKDNGYNVEDVEKDLAETTGLIAKDLLTIVKSHSPKIKINDTVHYIGDGLANKYIEATKVEYLTEHSDSVEEEIDG